MSVLRSCLLALTSMTTLALAACSQADRGPIEVRDAWSPAMPNTMAAVYLDIAVHQPDTLLGGNASIAQSTEMHATTEDRGMMRMRPLESLDLKAGETVRFERGGKHFMLMGLSRPLSQGEKFPMTLRFAKAGEIPVTVEVRAPGEGMH